MNFMYVCMYVCMHKLDNQKSFTGCASSCLLKIGESLYILTLSTSQEISEFSKIYLVRIYSPARKVFAFSSTERTQAKMQLAEPTRARMQPEPAIKSIPLTIGHPLVLSNFVANSCKAWSVPEAKNDDIDENWDRNELKADLCQPVWFLLDFLQRHLLPAQSKYMIQRQPALCPNELLSLYFPRGNI